MIKKLMIGFMVAIMIGIGFQGLANSVFAETPGSEPEEASYQYDWAYRYGNHEGDFLPFEVANRTQTQTRELNTNGDCDGEPDPQSVQRNLRVHQNYARRLLRQEQSKLNQSANNSPQQLGNGQGQ